MKKQMKTFLSMLLVVCLLSTTVLAAEINDEDYGVMPCFDHISDVAVGLSISLAGKANCDTGITLYDASHSAEITMVLYRTDDGNNWDEVKTWTYTATGRNIDLTKNWYVTSGYDYIVQSWVYVYDADGDLIETTAVTSPIKSY